MRGIESSWWGKKSSGEKGREWEEREGRKKVRVGKGRGKGREERTEQEWER